MIIGHFDDDVAADRFTGSVLCLNARLDEVEIVPNRGQSPRKPDYALTARTSHGAVDIGSAWKRMSERGTPYLSAALDQPLNAAFFMDAEGANAVLIWRRQRARPGFEAALGIASTWFSAAQSGRPTALSSAANGSKVA